jgi:Ca2+-binding EF-hand superfamily protein
MLGLEISYPEFVEAQDHWVKVHPKEVTITRKELRRQFDDLDTDHDGYVKIEQIRTFHDW